METSFKHLNPLEKIARNYFLQVVDLINKATLMKKEQDKVNNLKLVRFFSDFGERVICLTHNL